MSRRLTRRLTYSNVIATMALFMALGGVGYAAATVDSSSIVNNSVRGKDIHQRTIRGGDVRNNGLGGKQIKESKLGPVPDAQALQGVGPEAFVAAGTLVRYSFTLKAGRPARSPRAARSSSPRIASTTAPTRMATPARTWLGSTRRPRRTGP